VEERKTPTERPLTDEDRKLIRSLVIHDDGDIVVINKPAGIASQGGTNINKHLDRLMEGLKDRKGLIPKLLHRLDRDTSGVMLFARKAETVRELGRLFRDREIRKIYWAITLPAPEVRDGTIDAPIGKGLRKETMMIDEKEGKRAITDFSVIETAGKDAAFVAFWPQTGRTHQIRVHAALALETPILGDTRYGASDEIGGIQTAKRLHLHARRLAFQIPGTKEILDITAPLPDDLVKSWKAFGFDHEKNEDPFEGRRKKDKKKA
jgi:23S rRNA pseudouridine955/2504/2580 synthase